MTKILRKDYGPEIFVLNTDGTIRDWTSEMDAAFKWGESSRSRGHNLLLTYYDCPVNTKGEREALLALLAAYRESQEGPTDNLDKLEDGTPVHPATEFDVVTKDNGIGILLGDKDRVYVYEIPKDQITKVIEALQKGDPLHDLTHKSHADYDVRLNPKNNGLLWESESDFDKAWVWGLMNGIAAFKVAENTESETVSEEASFLALLDAWEEAGRP